MTATTATNLLYAITLILAVFFLAWSAFMILVSIGLRKQDQSLKDLDKEK